MFWFLVFAAIFLSVWFYNHTYTYWKRRNVPGPKPAFLVGNVWQNITLQKSFHDIVTDVYRNYRKYPAAGLYRCSSPCLVAIDPDLVKEISVKSFKHFQDNELHVDKSVDPIFGRNPFVLKGDEWKQTRAIITPSFTSGKMKSIFPLLDHVGQKMATYIDRQINEHNVPLECKQLSVKFTLENVASCAFGLDAKAFEDDESEFQNLANNFFASGSWENVKLFLVSLYPPLRHVLSIKLCTPVVEDRLREIIKTTLDYREANSIVRADYLNSMNQIRLSKPEFTYEDVTAQASTFLLDGYETSSTIMSFLLYELANDEQVQEKLRYEIQSKLAKNNDVLDYDIIQEMDYLQACFYESQRKNPALGSMGKMCTQDFTYTPTNPDFEQIPIRISKGTAVLLPLRGLASDSHYFPHPDRFIPERQLKENQSESVPFKPFGDGPRACLGRRFATLQIKIGIIYLLRKYRLSVNGKTQRPFQWDHFNFLLAPVGGMWIDFKPL